VKKSSGMESRYTDFFGEEKKYPQFFSNISECYGSEGF
jgi:hypothetical protein